MLMMNTGHTQVGRPSLGSWLTYGLGTENQNLPGFVVLCPGRADHVGPPLWNSGFLPAVHQGTFIADKVEKETEVVGKDFDPKKLISFIHNDKFSLPEQRRELDLLEQLDRMRLQRDAVKDPQLEATLSRWRPPTGCRRRRRTSSTSGRRARRRSSCTAPAAPPAAA